ncbi:DNA end-binding protein Ku [Desulfotomaculum arcticum]|uniref:Non-homologous end joining protein Ku n=1 Tax=Desulfotruncus arcticus DSM 17038 TaxID=1121424 RepID=A0A1I2SF95_9FIRM|nr:Ku protein [Desulfotruncus arcticus]SFG50389.1 DNA end-binding protein Ku [Desulfotomaculum arcticum] [Desulfotruncus arcticus DSM 17038]
MRPLWKGAITFGLIFVPVKLFAATEKKDIKFNYLHEKCSTPVRYKRYCPYCETEVQMEDIVRGYEYEKGRYITMSDEELDMKTGDKNRNVEILDFVDLSQIDPVYYDRSYYFGPGEGGQKVYELLRRSMEQTKRAAIARITLRSRESMAVIRPAEKALIMETMFYADEVRPPTRIEGAGGATNLHDTEIEMAVNLINSLSMEFKPEKYTSGYREALHERIQAKIAGEAVVEKPVIQETGNVVDLMTALKASIDLAKEQRGQKRAGPKTAKSAKAKRERKVAK